MKIKAKQNYSSVFEKQATTAALPVREKKEYRMKTMENIFLQLGNKENRYIFYCPDIAVVNNLVKLIYETAQAAKELGYSVVILHEINGFKCRWLLQQYPHLKDLEIGYIIKKKSSKSKKTQSNYSFQPSDTLIVPDQFQEVFDNLVEVKLIQKVVLASSYMGLSALVPGIDYSVLGVDNFLFTEEKIKNDYELLFPNIKGNLINNYPINTSVFTKRENVKEIYPVICISNVGNNELTQQVVNIFYSKFPNLRVFTFKILQRDNFETYLDCLKHSALLLVLDRNLSNNQFIYEAVEMGLPVGTFCRRECEGELGENIFFGNDAFQIADSLSLFCQQWLNESSTELTKAMEKVGKQIDLKSKNYKNYKAQLNAAFQNLQKERVQYFSVIKDSIEKEEALVVA